MQVKLIKAAPNEFNDRATGELVKGYTLVFYNEEAGETLKYFVKEGDTKGFDPKQLSTIRGKELEISTNVKTYQGKQRVILDKIVELVE